jgi:hypothetical protein
MNRITADPELLAGIWTVAAIVLFALFLFWYFGTPGHCAPVTAPGGGNLYVICS